MNAADQVILAGKLRSALLRADLAVTQNQRVPGGRSVRKGDYWIEDVGSTVLPDPPPRLLSLVKACEVCPENPSNYP